jgi:hypothetical protein
MAILMSLKARLDALARDDTLTLYRHCPKCGLAVWNGTQNETDEPCQHEAREILRGRADIVIERSYGLRR